MSKHFHFDLGNLPVVGWVVLIMVVTIMAGKLAEVPALFTIGVWGLGITAVFTIIAFVQEFL